MSTILIIGTGPLFSAKTSKIGGQCLRTWHFTKPLLDAGHAVSLFTIEIPDKQKSKGYVFEEKEFENFPYFSIKTYDRGIIRKIIKEKTGKQKFDALLGINPFPSFVACNLDMQIPIWADLNGYQMAEAQTKTHVYDDNSYLSYFWEQERDVIIRSDKFSAVSMPQLYALCGELAFVGRLSKETFEYNFVHHIPNAVNPAFTEISEKAESGLIPETIKDKNPFFILWSGGYNTWTDVTGLFESLEMAMNQNPKIYFVSTGGMIDGHDEKTYNKFLELIRKSKFKDRFLMLGWVPGGKILPLYQEAHLGINIDSFNYETIFGARNRLNAMMAAGLPVFTTLGTEISQMIADNDVGITVPIAKPALWAQEFIKAAEHRDTILQMGEKGRSWALDMFSYQKTVAPMLEWVKNPQFSPDNYIVQQKAELTLESLRKNQVRLQSIALKELGLGELLQAHNDLRAIRSKWYFKMLKKLKNIFFFWK